MSSHDFSPLVRYPLLLPHILYLCIKHRMLLSDIIHANPAFPEGGLPFSPKDKILDCFDGVLPYAVLSAKWTYDRRIEKGLEFAEAHGYPFILKPNGGHRGIDVHLVDERIELEGLLKKQTWDYMLQEFCGYPHEFGVFYCRMPGDTRGSIVSLTEKVVPVITGDGTSTVEGLIERSNAINKRAIREAMRLRLQDIPERGESIRTLVEASHSRGCIFLDAHALETTDLTNRINEICTIEGFYFGRLDVLARSIEEFQKGRFEIIEVNGATSEMIHIYDSRISLLAGLTVLRHQWSLLFEIAHLCKKRSARIPFWKFLGMYWSFYLSTRQAIGKLW